MYVFIVQTDDGCGCVVAESFTEAAKYAESDLGNSVSDIKSITMVGECWGTAE